MKKRQKKRDFFTNSFFQKNHKGIISDYLPWLLIAVAILAVVMVAVFVLKDKGISLVDAIKNLFGG